MSDHYPQYPGEDPGPVEPPRAPQHATPPQQDRHQPWQGRPDQVTWQQGAQPTWTPPPPPPRPEAPPQKPGAMRAAVWAMIVGAVVSLAQGALLLTEIDLLREAMYESARTSDPAFDDPGFDTFVDIMVVIIVIASSLFALVIAGVWAWMAVVNGRGRAWARITATVLGGVNIAMCLINLAFVPLQEMSTQFVGPGPGQSVAGVVLNALYLLVSVVAVVLLWLPPSNAFVRAVSAQTRWEQWSRRWGGPPPATPAG